MYMSVYMQVHLYHTTDATCYMQDITDVCVLYSNTDMREGWFEMRTQQLYSSLTSVSAGCLSKVVLYLGFRFNT